MKIGIDARMLGSTFGLGRYVQQLVRHLLEIDKENEYVLFLRRANWNEVVLLNESGEKCEPGDNICVPAGRNCRKVLADISWYGFKEQLQFPSIIKKEQLDLMHFPHWNVPFFYNDPFVVTIHDLTMFHFPRPEATTLGPVKFFLKDKVSRVVIRHAARSSRHILATSEFTKVDVCKTLAVAREKVTVTYQAPFSYADAASDKASGQKYDSLRPYVLYVGASYPHKNLDRLILAWQKFIAGGRNYNLLIAGRKDAFYERLVSSELFKQTKNIKYVGEISDSELVTLYKGASLYVIPSLYEGFGLTPLEAINFGVPVVASHASCLPEVLGEAAVYFDPENVDQMATQMALVLDNPEIRRELKENARRELVRYSWRRLAEVTKNIYLSSVGG